MSCLKYVAILAALTSAVYAAAIDESNLESPAMKVVGNVLDRCLSNDDPTTCLEEEAANALGRALRTDSLVFAPGVSLKRSPDVARFDEREGRAVEQLAPYDKMWYNLEKMLATRSININLGEVVGEARGKKKKYAQYFAIALATAAAILVPLKLKLIAWMAATALMTGKLALVIASLVGLKKLVSKPHEETTHVHYDGHRSDPNSHVLAYAGQAPGTIEYPA
ncbi:osiris 21 [Nesidiocoris tenuis]|uniref:Osiris 21 n=1 Tax=Nesidiocoris tenuis TaxID=355587 RepID=A0ABN7BEP6_9HEMI|nr:osiris 21 [Nesidiocoris tenuis]